MRTRSGTSNTTKPTRKVKRKKKSIANNNERIIPAYVNDSHMESFLNPDPQSIKADYRLKTLNGQLVPVGATVYKRIRRYFLVGSNGLQRVFLSKNVPEMQLYFYNRNRVPEDLEVFGEASKQSKMYVIIGDEEVPVFTQSNLRKFQLLYEIGATQAIGRDTQLIVINNNIYAQDCNTTVPTFNLRTVARSDRLPETAVHPSLKTVASEFLEVTQTQLRQLNSMSLEDEFSPFINFVSPVVIADDGSAVREGDVEEAKVAEIDVFLQIVKGVIALNPFSGSVDIQSLLQSSEEHYAAPVSENGMFAASGKDLVDNRKKTNEDEYTEEKTFGYTMI